MAGDMSAQYLNSVKAMFYARSGVRGGYLRWNKLPSGAEPLPDTFENLGWYSIQAQRTYDESAPLPIFSGLELEKRRPALFTRLQNVFDNLTNCKKSILELVRAREKLRLDYRIQERQYLMDRILAEDDRRQMLKDEFTEVDTAVQAMLFLTSVALMYSC
ncbi:hypothetical protein VKT23_019736 [Stygiomarasmius scandens]|uniref:Uncharacterized protein n=1 Tax=Marasmiellus scandens TaxID=2682957 RepID=A0ABR1IQ02_9AGAR